MSINLFTPQTMGELVRQMIPTKTFLRDTFFPRVITFDTETILVDYSKDKRYLAPFVNEKMGGSAVAMEGYETREFTPILVAPQTTTNAGHITSRMMGEPLFGGLSPAERAALKIGEDFRKLEEMITRREEWMCAQVLFTGRIPIIGKGVNKEFEINFDNLVVEDAARLWSDYIVSDPIGFFQDLEERLHKSSGLNPDIVIMARDVANAFMRNQQVKELMNNLRLMAGTIIPKNLPNGAKYLGHLLNPAVDIYIYDEWFIDDFTNPGQPETKPMVPPGHLLMGSTQMMGAMLYGAVTIIDQKTESFMTYEGPRIADTWTEKNPDQRHIRLSAKPLPVPGYFDGWCIADVLD
jgi:hypothetical protein